MSNPEIRPNLPAVRTGDLVWLTASLVVAIASVIGLIWYPEFFAGRAWYAMPIMGAALNAALAAYWIARTGRRRRQLRRIARRRAARARQPKPPTPTSPGEIRRWQHEGAADHLDGVALTTQDPWWGEIADHTRRAGEQHYPRPTTT